MSRFEEYLIEAKQVRKKDVYISSWREQGVWRAIVTERHVIAGTTKEFEGANREEAVSKAEDDFGKG